MTYNASTVTNQDWRNLENVNQNNMRILDESADKVLTAYYPLVPNISSANILFDISNRFAMTGSTATDAAFAWTPDTKVTVRFPDQPINTYPGMSAYSNAIQALIVTIINLPPLITLTNATDCYVVATLTINPIDSYRAIPLATIGAATEALPTTPNKIALFKLVLDGGVLVPEIDANCVQNYSLTNEFATRAETQEMLINNKVVSPDALQGIFRNTLTNENLDSLYKIGWYFQDNPIFSTLANGYPVALPGVLEVTARDNSSLPPAQVCQKYTTIPNNGTDKSKVFHRSFDLVTGSWIGWTQLIDQNGGVIDGGNFSVESAALQRKTDLGVGGGMVLTSEVSNHLIALRNQAEDSQIGMSRESSNNTIFFQNKKINGTQRRLATYETLNTIDGTFIGRSVVSAYNSSGTEIANIETGFTDGNGIATTYYRNGGTAVVIRKLPANQYLTLGGSNAAQRRTDPEAFALIEDILATGGAGFESATLYNANNLFGVQFVTKSIAGDSSGIKFQCFMGFNTGTSCSWTTPRIILNTGMAVPLGVSTLINIVVNTGSVAFDSALNNRIFIVAPGF